MSEHSTNPQTLVKENKGNLFSTIGVILSIAAISITVFTLTYLIKGYQFSKSSLTIELHRYFMDNQLFRLNGAYLARFSYDTSFYEKNRADIQELFNLATYFPLERKLVFTKEAAAIGDTATNLMEKYLVPLEDLKVENDRLRNEAIKLILFYNKLGIFLQNGLLDEDLAKRLFGSDFKIFYDWYFVPCAFFYGDFLDNLFYLYLTGQRYEVPFFKTTYSTNVSQKYKNIDPNETLKVPKTGILFLSTKWK